MAYILDTSHLVNWWPVKFLKKSITPISPFLEYLMKLYSMLSRKQKEGAIYLQSILSNLYTWENILEIHFLTQPSSKTVGCKSRSIFDLICKHFLKELFNFELPDFTGSSWIKGPSLILENLPLKDSSAARFTREAIKGSALSLVLKKENDWYSVKKPYGKFFAINTTKLRVINWMAYS